MHDDELLQAATAVRRGVIRLARRLRMERPGPRRDPAGLTEPGPGSAEPGSAEPGSAEPGSTALNNAELSNLAMSVLAHLHRRGPMSPGGLAAAERLQPQSLTRTLAGLERQHLITRQPDGRDGRRSLLALTEAGGQALITDMRRRDDWLAEAMAAQLTRAERELLRLAGELMERLAEQGDRAPSLPAPVDG